ncbi:hypothetical protein MMC25_000127 [Agyrium rufum]|nr:hypothetical protein [Agyrium rufum]
MSSTEDDDLPRLSVQESIFGGIADQSPDVPDHHVSLLSSDDPPVKHRGSRSETVSNDELDSIRGDDATVVRKEYFPNVEAAETKDDESLHVSSEGEERRRYKGKASTYRQWIAPERDLKRSLDRLDAQDLSLHLYKAHVLGAKAREAAEAAKNDEIPEELTLQPPPSWTAWPMEPEDVPRGQFQSLAAGNNVAKEGWRSLRASQGPGEEIEEDLIALMLRQARERLDVRPSEANEDNVLDQYASGQQDAPDSSITILTSPTLAENVTNYSLRPRRVAHPHKREVLSSRPSSKATQIPLKRPRFMLDDDRANLVLQPTARHLLSNLDKLLTGLHHARAAYQPKNNESDMETVSSQTDADLGENAVDSELDQSQPISPSKRQRSRASTNTESPSKRQRHATSNRSSSLPRSRGSTPRKHGSQPSRAPLGLRDWSDILGMASLTGWDQDVVKRAAERCANLFEEEMEFRTLEEKAAGRDAFSHLNHSKGRSIVSQPYSSTVPTTEEDDEDDSSSSTSKRQSSRKPRRRRIETDHILVCPFSGCNRSQRGFSRQWNLNKHLREIHARDSNDVDSADEMEGGVHVDGFLRELKIRHGWRGVDKKKRRAKSRSLRQAGVRDSEEDEGSKEAMSKLDRGGDQGSGRETTNST